MMRSADVKVAGYSLCILMPMLVPLGIRLHLTWLAPGLVFGFFPVLSLVIGEDHSPPLMNVRRNTVLKMYLNMLPRLYAVIWIVTLIWASSYAALADLSFAHFAALIISLGLSSALAICTAHELLHRRTWYDVLLARLMTTLCLHGHMVNEHLHHHATVGTSEYGSTAQRGTSAYRFAISDLVQGLRNAWAVETGRIKRCRLRWWHNQVVQGYIAVSASAALFALVWGPAGLIFFVGQAIFAIFAFEVIMYVHHYGLELKEGEELGPQHAWAHHCWLTNCLTFNNTFHGDHHLRPRTPYFELHAMYGAPRLPASYFSMFCLALMPALWYRVIDPRLDALERGRVNEAEQLPDWLRAQQQCRW